VEVGELASPSFWLASRCPQLVTPTVISIIQKQLLKTD